MSVGGQSSSIDAFINSIPGGVRFFGIKLGKNRDKREVAQT